MALSSWTKGVGIPNDDRRINVWSLNGFGEPVLTGGMYTPDETRILDRVIREYCASKNVTLTQLCGGDDHKKFDNTVRGAWKEISKCLPHRTVLSVYRKSIRKYHGMMRGKWSEEEVVSLFRLVDIHGRRWRLIQGKLGRSDVDCRNKYESCNTNYHRGKWSVEDIELLIQKVRESLDVPFEKEENEKDMDVREINLYTIENDTKISWVAVSNKINRGRMDCYFKWKLMTRRSNRKAAKIGLEPIPMARESLKFDVRSEYHRWKATKHDLPSSSSSPLDPSISNIYSEVDRLFFNANKDTVTVKDIIQSIVKHFHLPNIDMRMKKLIKLRLTDLINGRIQLEDGEDDIDHEACISTPHVTMSFDKIDDDNPQKLRSIRLLESIVDSRATRYSDVPYAMRNELEELIDTYATTADMDLPLWKLSQVVRDLVSS